MSTSDDRHRWIPRPRSSDEVAWRLFCVPRAGGGTAEYHRWSRHLPAEVDLLPVCLPGREGRIREAPVDDLESLLPRLETAIRPALDRPFALLGHSMGALIAFELTRRLVRRGGPLPVCLFVLAGPAPQAPRHDPPLHTLPDAEFLERLQSRYGRLQPEGSDGEELMRMLLPMLRADVRLVETYRHQPDRPLPLPIVAMAGADDASVPPASMEGWREHTRDGFSIRVVPGDHFFPRAAGASLVTTVARRVNAQLSVAVVPPPSRARQASSSC